MTEKRYRRTQVELADIDAAIIEVIAQDAPVTLRGVFYRVVSLGRIEKSDFGYRVIMRRLMELRRNGRVSYGDITDGTRWFFKPTTYDDDMSAAIATARAYRKNLWLDQSDVVHVLSEKDAITGVISGVTQEWDVALGIMRGYSSETFAYSEAAAIIDAQRAGKTVYVYNLGDHDPSGVDAWCNFKDKVSSFIVDADGDGDLDGVVFERLAVTEQQIEDLDLPTRPPKGTDSRSAGFGDAGSVEVDAIPAPTLREIVREAIEQHIDQDQLERLQAQEERERENLWRLADLAIQGNR